MRVRRRISSIAFCCVLSGWPAVIHAQNITLKTVPVPTGEQFLLFPTGVLGMASVSMAVDDSDGRPFQNPAVRPAEAGARLYITPTFYGEASNWVGGRSLPVAVLWGGERFHGGFSVATQQLRDRRWWGGWGSLDDDRNIREDPSNGYLFGTVGGKITEGWTAGLSAFRASLNAVDGVNLLYGRATGIRQDGSVTEYRMGFEGGAGAGRLEATVTRTEVDMMHEVDYDAWVWSGVPDDPAQQVRWTELNPDHTITWGTRLRYTRPAGEASRVGVILGGSFKDHPKIPNYNIVDIPRDPGHSEVFNIGIGTSRTEGGATFSIEALFEPGRSHTWAFADSVTTLPSGATLNPGDKTVDNRFVFRNWTVGVGFEREHRRFEWQLGLRVRQIDYTLDQHNYLAERRRDTEESWMEWSPSWGAGTRLGSIEIRYAGRATSRGWPEERWGVTRVAVDDALGVDFVVGPTGEVNLPEYRVTTHRFEVSVPLLR